MLRTPFDRLPHRPAVRELRVFALDPSLTQQLETWEINETVLPIRWEGSVDDAPDPGEPPLGKGPVGEYLEVVDVDPASQCAYAPVDLNHRYVLAKKGLDPSDGDPQFHQQMVYAVAMYTIDNFERALGRSSLWAARQDRQRRPEHLKGDERTMWEYVPRLRIYPHAIRDANAFYSPDKKALLFGYFPAPVPDEGQGAFLPGGMVFTCLSHDIVAHETTHALLDGMHRRLIEPTSPDTLAFHEAFADIVSLFQHFTLPDVLKSQIARTRGDLRRQNLLGQLAQELGTTLGGRGALRDALGGFNKDTNQWEPSRPDPTALRKVFEPHARGSILVAAVFDAFLAIYQTRVADLLRLASEGTGILREGDLPPDLVNRLSHEAARTAKHVLTMCIRALDYIPPTDFNFGEYLRALVTADYSLYKRDERGYRVAFVEAFRRRGIFPRSVRSLSVDSLLWESPVGRDGKSIELTGLRALESFNNFQTKPPPRWQIHLRANQRAKELHDWLERQDEEFFALLGLRKGLKTEVHSVRLGRRVGPDDQLLSEVFIQITQKRPGFLTVEEQAKADANGVTEGDFKFRGGCTLILDPDDFTVKYCVRKSIESEARLERQRQFLRGESEAGSLRATYFSSVDTREPFAILHRGHDEEV